MPSSPTRAAAGGCSVEGEVRVLTATLKAVGGGGSGESKGEDIGDNDEGEGEDVDDSDSDSDKEWIISQEGVYRQIPSKTLP